jgi:hypothetical protein
MLIPVLISGIVIFEVFYGLNRIDQGHPAARHDTLFYSGAGGAQGILNPMFFLFQLGFGCRAHANNGHATGQFGQALLQFLAVVVAGAVSISALIWLMRP